MVILKLDSPNYRNNIVNYSLIHQNIEIYISGKDLPKKLLAFQIYNKHRHNSLHRKSYHWLKVRSTANIITIITTIIAIIILILL